MYFQYVFITIYGENEVQNQEILDGIETSQRITEVKQKLTTQLKAGKDVADRLLHVVAIEQKFLGKARKFMEQAIGSIPELARIADEFAKIEHLSEIQRASLEQNDLKEFIKAQSEEENIYRSIEEKLVFQLQKKKEKKVSLGKFRKLAAIMTLFLALSTSATVATAQANSSARQDTTSVAQNIAPKVSDAMREIGGPGSGEYIVVDTVITQLLAARMPDRPQHNGRIGGMYTDQNWNFGSEVANRFKLSLMQQGYAPDSAQHISDQLSKSGIILIAQSALGDNSFSQALVHERVHRSIDRLTPEVKEMMLDAARAVTRDLRDNTVRACIGEVGGLENRDQLNNCLLAGGETARSIYEFYPFAANGRFPQTVIDGLQARFPEAFRLFVEISQQAQR